MSEPCVWCDGKTPLADTPPLGLRVAEALGQIHNLHVGPHGSPHWSGSGALTPRYDVDWSAVGPLIERLKITLQAPEKQCDAPQRHTCMKWNAYGFEHDYAKEPAQHEGSGDTPLLAVCNLILSLKAAGELATSEGGNP